MTDVSFDLARRAVESAVAAGATYADARVVIRRHERIAARNGEIDHTDRDEDAGIGVRALLGSSWGFAATSDISDQEARRVGELATAIARASARVRRGESLELADVPVESARWETPYEEDPFSISLSDKADLLVGVTADMKAVEGVELATGAVDFWDTDKWFVSSQGHEIFQHVVESGGGIAATAVGESETQRRSYPQSFGEYQTGGYEVIRGFDLAGRAPSLAEEAVRLLSADQCPSGEFDLILEGSQVALQIHESVGHATELDRILGWEAAFAGTSFLNLDRLGTLRYGSELMNITADATIPGALGTFGYDDEGTPAQSVDLVRDGIWVGVLSGRDTAAIAGLAPGGMVRGDGFNRVPMVRMTNVGLRPGPHDLEEIVASTSYGILMETNRSWSIDDKRLNFQFGCEVAWEIEDGKKGRMLKNPTYTGITPRFWGSMDMLAGGDEWHPWGTPNCGKGQPMQVGHTGHPAAPARFKEVRIGVTGGGSR
ncbi:MAG: TldD/PmbA family protein [Acidimicrobiia bacterium]